MDPNESKTSGNKEERIPAIGIRSGAGGVIDYEAIIRRSFESDHLKGCELLFKRYYQSLCSHAVRFVYSRAAAEDIVMEVFSRFWQHKIYNSVETSYRAYLFTTVRHAAFAYLKSEFGKEQAIATPVDLPNGLDNSCTPQQLLQYHELHSKIEDILKALPPQSQKVFIMSRFEGKKNQVIADELNLSTKTIEGHITKALSILKRSLRENGFITMIAAVFSLGDRFVVSFFLMHFFTQV